MHVTEQANGEPDMSGKIGDQVPKEIKRLHVNGYLNAVAWSPDGSRLATLGKFGSVVTLFETSTWKKLNEFERLGSAYSYNSLAFLHDNSLAVATSLGDYSKDPRYYNTPLTDSRYKRVDFFSVVNYDALTGKILRYLPDVAGPAPGDPPQVNMTNTFTTSRDGALLAGIPGKGGVLLYDTHAGRLLREFLTPVLSASAWSAEIKADMARAHDEKFPLPAFIRDDAVSVALSPDGKQIASGTNWGLIHIYDTATGSLLRSFPVFPSQEYTCNAIAYSPDGQFIAVGRRKNENIDNPDTNAVFIVKADDGSLVATLPGSPVTILGKVESDGVWTVSWSPIGDVLAVGDGESLRLWRISKAGSILLLNVKISRGAFKTAFSPQGILAATDNNEVVLYQ